MLVFFVGSDQYRVREKLLSLRERFFREFPEGEVRKIDVEDARNAFGEIVQAIQEQGLFAKNRLVEIKNIEKMLKDDQNKLVEFLEKDFSKNTSVWVGFFGEKIDKRSRLYKTLKKYADEHEYFDPLKSYEVGKWLKEYAKKNYSSVRFEGNALDILATRGGSNLFFLTKELEKLFTLKEKEKTITPKDIEEYVVAQPQEAIFLLLDELSRKNISRAFEILQEQYDQGSDAFAILGMFAYHMRTLLSIVSMYEEDGVRDGGVIAKTLKIHPFVVEKTLKNIHTLKLSHLKTLMQFLSRLDISIKTGKITPEFAVEEFIVRF
jgi:DNA polymerase-3 subunit delta